MDELISVIIPVYNVEKYLAKCIDSIINQTYKNLEIILVDDGSTDQSSTICDRYSNIDSRIKVIHKNNGGLSDARNAGMKIAQGIYYSFIDSDDYIKNNTLKVLYESLILNDCDIAICNMMRFYDDGKISEFYNPVNKLMVYKGEDRFITLNQPSVCNKLFKANLFENIQFPVAKFYEDTYIYHELLYKAKNVVLTGHVGYMYLSRKESILGQPIYTDRYFDFMEAVWYRAIFLIENKVYKYEVDACLSYYSSLASAYKNIKKTSLNDSLFKQAVDRYYILYKYMLKHVSFKQKVRLVLLKYLPQLHNKIY